MKRKGLLLAVLILAAVCVCCAALADDYPVNPYQEEVWEFDRMSNLVGKTRAVSYYYDGKITIEVGGKDKSFDQIANIPDSYILADSMEFPIGKKLPLWLVGFLY